MRKSNIVYIRSRKKGPEQKIENVAVQHLPNLLKKKYSMLWIGGSVPIGAGIPDMVAAIFKPILLNLIKIENLNIQLLSYLRTVPCAKPETMAKRLSLTTNQIKKQMKEYKTLGIIVEANGIYKFSSTWKELFSEIVTVEAKVSNWKSAANQAIRNKIFSHYSYVALPMGIANRIRKENIFIANGLGILGIEKEKVNIIRHARKSTIIIWEYYYKLAYYIAQHYGGINNGI